MDKIKLFYVGVILFSLVGSFVFFNAFFDEKEMQVPSQEQADEDFKQSFSFFAEHGPGPSTEKEYNGMVLTYITNKEVFD